MVLTIVGLIRYVCVSVAAKVNLELGVDENLCVPVMLVMSPVNAVVAVIAACAVLRLTTSVSSALMADVLSVSAAENSCTPVSSSK